jgi:serine phosphatase RsbU (regulator of sigma subunit)/anti-sigma regulatory factor (Ser/Thr protein kinase)
MTLVNGGGRETRTTAKPYERLLRVQAVTDAALAHLPVEDLLDELLIRVRDVMDVDTVAILLHDEASNVLVARAAKGIEEEVEQGVRVPVGKGFAGKIAAEQRPVIIDRIDHSNVMNPILREKGIISLLGVPLIAQGRFIGVLHVGSLTHRQFNAEDQELLQLVADRVALAIHVSLYERERMLAETLQRSMLPESLPHIFGVDFLARYLPAKGGDVGGDWYDAFMLTDGRIAVAVGDVVGRGLPAATVMSRLRNSLRAFAFEGHEPARTVELLNEMVHFLDASEMATLIFGVLDPRHRELTLVNAGHLPALLCRKADGITSFVETEPYPPLGVVTSLRPRSYTIDLKPGDAFVFYTDGIVERRTTPLDDRLELLRDCVHGEDDMDAMADRVFAKLTEDAPSEDDMALLIVRLSTDVVGPFTTIVDAHPRRLGEIRATLRGWLSDLGVPSDRVFDILVAVGEACANSIEHGYGPAGGTIELTLARSDHYLEALVRDHGRWREPRGAHRGRGIKMMRKLAESVDLVRSPDGTDVRLGWNIGAKEDS